MADGAGWSLPDGTVVFANKAQLALAPNAPIAVDESGTLWHENMTGPDLLLVWTGTLAGGKRDAANTCKDWTDAFGQFARLGSWAAADDNWTAFDQVSCKLSRHLYCFEQ
jgi:hypothetical protein